MRTASRGARQRLLETAFHEGIRHFDVARMYGLGRAETELARFLKRHRDEVTVATKFGIGVGRAAVLARAQAPARALAARSPALRRRIRAAAGAAGPPPPPRLYDAVTMRESLETSLRELRTDHVDVLLLHEPRPIDTVRFEELVGALEAARDAGKLRGWGISGDPDDTYALLPRFDGNAVLQVRDNVLLRSLRRPAAPADASAVTFGVLNEAVEWLVEHVGGDADRRRHWEEAVGVDCADPGAVAPLLLADAVRENAVGCVLFATTKPERIASMAAAASDPLALERSATLARLVGHALDATPALSAG